MAREVLVLRDGRFVPKEGEKGALLPENLRQLPSEIVTREDADNDKAHALDPPHIVNTIEREFQKAEAKDAAPTAKKTWDEHLEQLLRPKLGAHLPLDQFRIDVVRFKIQRQMIKRMIRNASEALTNDPDACFWVNFPTNNVFNQELHFGRQPQRKDLLPHLRNFQLEIRPLGDIPPLFAEELKNRGIDVPDVKRYYAQMKAISERKKAMSFAYDVSVN